MSSIADLKTRSGCPYLFSHFSLLNVMQYELASKAWFQSTHRQLLWKMKVCFISVWSASTYMLYQIDVKPISESNNFKTHTIKASIYFMMF